ncbi:MAG: N-acetylmuramoyl-L-alanine amidase [Clostridiales bacterium]|jgi:N-acetylmuramoyl-L-alanine amidase|nr:N-acetylmuramoyl-L-alanine amidase [Clostridiales bacterium]
MRRVKVLIWVFILSLALLSAALCFLVFFWDNLIDDLNTVELKAASLTIEETPDPEPFPSPTMAPSPTPTQTPAPSRPNIVALIDPGHGGRDAGAAIDGIYEKDINLKIAVRLHELLLAYEGEEFGVMLTRSDDTYLTLEQRVNMANELSDFFFSIHCNVYEFNSATHGATIFYKSHPEDKPFSSEEMASVLQRGMIDATGAKDRGIGYSDEYYLLNHTRVPTNIVEAGFMSNPSELRLLTDDNYIDKIAQGLKNGVLNLLNLDGGAAN